MNRKSTYRIIPGILKLTLLIVVVSMGMVCSSYAESKSGLFDIDLPVYPNGYSIRQGNESPVRCKYVHYKVNIEFPAREVIELYDKTFHGVDFRDYSDDGYGTRRWENFSYSAGEWEITDHVPARFIATWVDEKKEKRIVLVLGYRYEANNDQKWKKVLWVDCKICQFFDSRRIEAPETSGGHRK